MRSFGCLIVIACSVALGVGYKNYLTRGVRIASGYLGFIKHLRTRVSCYMEPSDSCARGFGNEDLASIGFIRRVEEGCDLHTAFHLAENVGVPKRLTEIFDEYFSGFGKGYLDLELKRADACIEKAEEALREAEADASRRARAGFATLLAVSLGVSLLII